MPFGLKEAEVGYLKVPVFITYLSTEIGLVYYW